MPQIGWFEILVVAILAILIIGPKDFPIVSRKIGKWFGTLRSYLSNFQKDMDDIKNLSEEEISAEDNLLKNNTTEKKDEA